MNTNYYSNLRIKLELINIWTYWIKGGLNYGN